MCAMEIYGALDTYSRTSFGSHSQPHNSVQLSSVECAWVVGLLGDFCFHRGDRWRRSSGNSSIQKRCMIYLTQFLTLCRSQENIYKSTHGSRWETTRVILHFIFRLFNLFFFFLFRLFRFCAPLGRVVADLVMCCCFYEIRSMLVGDIWYVEIGKFSHFQLLNYLNSTVKS